MLLDEPTNHLDLPTIEWLEATLSSWKGAYVLVSHDRRFLSNLTRAVLWLDRGIVRRLDKGYDAFEEWSTGIIEREATERHKLDRLIERETEWAGKSIRARRTRNEGRLRALGELRKQRRQQIGPTGRATIEVGAGRAVGLARHHRAQHLQELRRQDDRARLLGAHLPQGPGRADRPQRRGQDDPAQDADRRARARHRLGEARRQPDAGGDRPAPHRARSRQDAVGDPGRPQRPCAGARHAAARHDLPARISVQGRAGAPAGAHALRRRAQPPAARQGAGRAVQHAGARRADQRPRRRHARPACRRRWPSSTAPSCW